AADRDRAPIPSLLATAGVHHHLVRQGTRTRCGLVVETGDAREVHHCALLLGYGAGVVTPYLAFETLDALSQQRALNSFTPREAGNTRSSRNTRRSSTIRAAGTPRCAGCSTSSRPINRSRSTKSSPWNRSSSASRPARCRTDPSVRKRTRRSRSR